MNIVQGIKIGAISVASLFFLGFGVGSSVTAPSQALVYVDSTSKTYVAPSCMRDLDLKLAMMTIREARNFNFSPAPECRDSGGFIQEARSLSGQVLENIGLLPRIKSRWNSDGTWNW